MKKPELLAPAGDLEKLKIACMYGADAVFIGATEFGLRSNADNFSIEEIKEGVQFANQYNAKIYVTTNIYAHEENTEGIIEFLKSLEDAGITGIIVADPFIIEKCLEYTPKIEVHISTQQSITNYETANFWHDLGAQRVVLARELNLEEIKEVKENTKAEIEIFIHGAMCISYSGRCTLSNHMTARDSNRGGCCQSCRWEYDLVENDVKFSMSPKDLNAIAIIPQLMDIGIDSFKIEGRMRSIHYIATTVLTYRKLIDDYYNNPKDFIIDEKYLEEIQKCANRKISNGYFLEEPTNEDQMYNSREEHPSKEFIGVVKEYNEIDKIVTIEQRNYFKPNDTIEFFGPEISNFKFQISSIQDELGNDLDAARHPKQIIKFALPYKVYKNNMLRGVKK